MGELKRIIGDKIRNVRNARGMTLQQLSETTGLQTSYLGDVERGKRNTSLDSLEKIMNALDIRPGDLFDFRQVDINSSEFEISSILEVHYQFLKAKKTEDVKMIHRITKDIFNSIEGSRQEKG
ncbi:helix-turn-helix transcriptional regulator [Paenibacillus frigoriresistens]|uniref:helix-turn-helix domain-containing protein n=1 Tax=Paenibacillus alginolyticus TaxID=59839 RepID=UPI0015639F62|nr:helix-turn-helix transcriptional regulator [Paenibacillus frigoriresistens]NRF93619.1 helix-turn-helix transcriptional regulator [Paenibacillus frigoriresistens]